MRLTATIIALLVATGASAQTLLPPNTIKCEQFSKIEGAWIAHDAWFDIPGMENAGFSGKIYPGEIRSQGFDLFELLETKCASK